MTSLTPNMWKIELWSAWSKLNMRQIVKNGLETLSLNLVHAHTISLFLDHFSSSFLAKKYYFLSHIQFWPADQILTLSYIRCWWVSKNFFQELALYFFTLPEPLIRERYIVFLLQSYCHVLTMTLEMLDVNWGRHFGADLTFTKVWLITYFHQSRIPNLRIFLLNIHYDFFFNWQTEKNTCFDFWTNKM